MTTGVGQGVFLPVCTGFGTAQWCSQHPAQARVSAACCSAMHTVHSVSLTQRLPDQHQDTAFLGTLLMPADLISAAGPCWRLRRLCCTGHSWRAEICFQTAEPHPREKVGLAPSHCCSPAGTLLPEHGWAIKSLHHPWPCCVFAGSSHLSFSI